MTRLREVIVTTGLLWSSTAFAFECTAARGDVERAICANRATKAADDAMNGAFERIKTILPAEQGHALVVNQRRSERRSARRRSRCRAESAEQG